MKIDNAEIKQSILEDIAQISELRKVYASKDVYTVAKFSLFSRFVDLEKFIINSYINYAMGETSITGFKPKIQVIFSDINTLKKFHKQIDKFITIRIIKELYIDMFGDGSTIKNPFSNLFSTVFLDDFDKLEKIRNVIAHQSEDAYSCFYNKCSNGCPIILDDYLFRYNGDFYNYNLFMGMIEQISESIVNPI